MNINEKYFIIITSIFCGAQWLRHHATNQQVAGSIPNGVIGIFQLRYAPGVNSASNRNEYQVYFLGLKAAGA
jgi:hypothetical protein